MVDDVVGGVGVVVAGGGGVDVEDNVDVAAFSWQLMCVAGVVPCVVVAEFHPCVLKRRQRRALQPYSHQR